jgi:hypothetical protein
LYGNGLYPLITRPTRITKSSATLIDNIFTNEYRNVDKSGILISDVSDHLPIFFVCKYDVKFENCKNKYMYKRQLDEESINKFINDVSNVSWETVEQIKDPSIAYDKLIDTISSLYKKHCPVKKKRKKRKKEKRVSHG